MRDLPLRRSDRIVPSPAAGIWDTEKDIKRIAENPAYFTFLRDCKGAYQIVLGDARLKMEEHGRDHQYGLIVAWACATPNVAERSHL